MQDETHIEKQSLKEEEPKEDLEDPFGSTSQEEKEFRAIRLIDRCIRDLRRLKSGLGN